MADGSNIERKVSPQLSAKVLETLGFRAIGSKLRQGTLKLVMKDGAPSDDTAADAPDNTNSQAEGTLLYDYTNDAVYICTHYASTSDFHWKKINE